MTPRHIALALLVVLIWGVNFVVIHEGLEGVPPLLFAAIRFSCIVPFVAVVEESSIPRSKEASIVAISCAWRDEVLQESLRINRWCSRTAKNLLHDLHKLHYA